MKSDIEIYNEIASTLISSAPEVSKKIKMKAEMKYGDDHLKATYFYEDADGVENWFLPKGDDVAGDMLDLLVELKSYFNENNLFKHGKPWVGATLHIDIVNSKINCDFIYD
ncbi:hypothetical protein [Xanthomonas sacchari]|uniref:hypothetical protein n=1 Tax=Xanthomonas sacchari TaxID=56458 RepID=UPI002250AE1E|nr:hypothetical protein [Xanthomonas sacchari]UYK72705.1 hypothetical protein NG828_21395 [Xanthomonas sacchari]